MLKTESFKRGSLRVTNNDSKEEKSGTESVSRVNGSRIRKLLPPLVEYMF